MPLSVTAVPCLSDNYVWILRDAATGAVAVCDPGEAGPAIAAVERLGGRLDQILLTHHHGDHIAGVAELHARFGGRIIGAAADAHRLPALDQAVREGDGVALGESRARVIDTPGHTVGHIAFHFAEGDVLLCGDTLFSLGCGRLIEGDAAMMFQSLGKLAALPEATLVCCGHEYTESNARFALTAEPANMALRARAEEARAQRAAGKPTVPTTIGQERAANPFLRAGDAARLAAIRSAKDSFR
ncbi:hydroxyacylglutathione hydrolase [Paracraurococcus ruber]|uniref:Hydroxyacylglutathione hydrolase n=1 Tax=Paracraurococcus ruber TaxID=77675 RepID=A0ABS1D778_9PROT|nr:hydroxyacylglutathione hydrolase [Paracraurococcus ruber]MBK1661922.1 hydroxyacylglutathione hydrolase [Paracraurococcus ruber]TDG16890.1 hydroxyacylglutathione hydrolase [Paracraurococcus ruber]